MNEWSESLSFSLALQKRERKVIFNEGFISRSVVDVGTESPSFWDASSLLSVLFTRFFVDLGTKSASFWDAMCRIVA